jgi:hypothetical protein
LLAPANNATRIHPQGVDAIIFCIFLTLSISGRWRGWEWVFWMTPVRFFWLGSIHSLAQWQSRVKKKTITTFF